MNIEILSKKSNFNKVVYFHRKNMKGRGSAVIYGFKKLFNKNIRNKYTVS